MMPYCRFVRDPILIRVSTVIAVLGLLFGLLGPQCEMVLAQVVASDRHAEVIAQGTGTLPTGSVVWRVVQGTAQKASESVKAAYPLGFIFVPGGEVEVDLPATGAQLVLQDGEAGFQPANTEELRRGAETKAVTYLGLELVPAGAATSVVGGNQLLTQSDAFPAPSGRRDVNLVRDILTADEEGILTESTNPTYIYVTDGDLTVQKSDGTSADLGAGDGLLLTGPATLKGGMTSGARYLATAIGDEVATQPGGTANQSTGSAGANATATTTQTTKPTPTFDPADTGALLVGIIRCPPSAVPSSGVDPDLTKCVLDEAGPGAVITNVTRGVTFPLAKAPIRGIDHTYRWDMLPTGTYTIDAGLAGSPRTYVVSAGNTLIMSNTFEVKRSTLTQVAVVFVDKAAAPSTSQTTSPATLQITFSQCPAGLNPANGALGSCIPVSPGAAAAITSTTSGMSIPLAKAPFRHGTSVGLAWGTIPAGTYTINPDLKGAVWLQWSISGDATTTNASQFDVTPHTLTSLHVYLYTPGATNGVTNLRISVLLCPDGVNPEKDDRETCAPVAPAPGTKITDLALGTGFSLYAPPFEQIPGAPGYFRGHIPAGKYRLDFPSIKAGTILWAEWSLTGDPAVTHGAEFDVKADQSTLGQLFLFTPSNTVASPMAVGDGNPSTPTPEPTATTVTTTGTGSLRARVLTCGAGDDPPSGATAGCVSGDAGPNATIQDAALVNAYLFQNAPSRDGSDYVWPALATGDYIADGFAVVDSGTLVYVVATTPSDSGDFAILDGAETEVTVYVYPDPSSSAPTPTPDTMASPVP